MEDFEKHLFCNPHNKLSYCKIMLSYYPNENYFRDDCEIYYFKVLYNVLQLSHQAIIILHFGMKLFYYLGS